MAFLNSKDIGIDLGTGNVLVSIKGEKLRKVKDYPRETVTQAKPVSMVSRPTLWDNDYY